MIGADGLEVVALVVTAIGVPLLLPRVWSWALRPDERFDAGRAALERCNRRVRGET